VQDQPGCCPSQCERANETRNREGIAPQQPPISPGAIVDQDPLLTCSAPASQSPPPGGQKERIDDPRSATKLPEPASRLKMPTQTEHQG